ncbi:phospholipid scramblase family member 5-like [Lissotriton helveticus]
MAFQGDKIEYEHQYQPQQDQPQQYQPQQYQPQQNQPQQNQPQQYQGNEAGPPQSYQAAGTSGFQPVPYMAALPNIPPGLEYLTQVDQILIHQKRHSMFQTGSEFEILNAVSQKIFNAIEEKECWGPRLDVRVYDNSKCHVLNILLPDQCCNRTEELEVYSPTSGSLIGYIAKNWGAFSISFSILNEAKESVLRVVGPGFEMTAFKDVNFEVKTSNEAHTVGRITRVWRGLRKEIFSSNDHYSVQFPIDLDVKVKALLLSTGIFLYYLYYEQRNKDSSSSAHGPTPYRRGSY